MMIKNLNIYCSHPSLEELLMKVSEVSTAIAELAVQLTKVQGEILGKIADLEAALVDVDLPEAAVDALNEVRAVTQALDAIVPDVEPEAE